MSKEADIRTEVLHALVRLIEQFLERKQIALEILLERSPGFFKTAGLDKILNIDDIDERIEQAKDINTKIYADLDYDPDEPRNGWHYFLHGHSCRLTHATTKEPLEWNVGHPNSFTIEWFGENLEWRMQNQRDYPDIIIINEWVRSTGRSIYEAISVMQEKNILTRYEGFAGSFLNKDALER